MPLALVDAWHAGRPAEAPLAPALPFVDAHHHLFPAHDAHDRLKAVPSLVAEQLQRSYGRLVDTVGGFSAEDLLHEARDLNLVATVYVEARSYYDKNAPAHLRSVGETRTIASLCSKTAGNNNRVGRGFVAALDLSLARNEFAEALEAHRAAAAQAGGTLSGIRYRIAFDRLNEIVSGSSFGAALLPNVAPNSRLLGEKKLVVDVWLYHEQLEDLYKMVAAAPSTTFVCDHVAMPIRVGSRNLQQVWEAWKQGITKLSLLPNVVVKFGGLTMGVCGHSKEDPWHSADLVTALTPWFEVVHGLFPRRVMFESNWPMDKNSVSYVSLFNTFIRLSRHLTPQDRADLFYECANRTYHLGLPSRPASDFEFPQHSL